MARRVALSKIVEALMDRCGESTTHLNIKTGEIEVVTDEHMVAAEDGVDLDDSERPIEFDWEREAIETAAKVIGSEDFIALPDQFDINEYRIMERFCLSLSEPDQRDQMLDAIQGRGAFRMFKSTVLRLNIAEDWEKYRLAAFREIAIAWCEENDLPFDE